MLEAAGSYDAVTYTDSLIDIAGAFYSIVKIPEGCFFIDLVSEIIFRIRFFVPLF